MVEEREVEVRKGRREGGNEGGGWEVVNPDVGLLAPSPPPPPPSLPPPSLQPLPHLFTLRLSLLRKLEI